MTTCLSVCIFVGTFLFGAVELVAKSISEFNKRAVIEAFGIELRQPGVTAAIVHDRIDGPYRTEKDIDADVQARLETILSVIGGRRLFVQRVLNSDVRVNETIYLEEPDVRKGAPRHYRAGLMGTDQIFLLLLRPVTEYKTEVLEHTFKDKRYAEIQGRMRDNPPTQFAKQLGLEMFLNDRSWFRMARRYAIARIDMRPTVTLTEVQLQDPTSMEILRHRRRLVAEGKMGPDFHHLFPEAFAVDIQTLLAEQIRALTKKARDVREEDGISLEEDAEIKQWASGRLKTDEGREVLEAMVEAVPIEEFHFLYMGTDYEELARVNLERLNRVDTAIARQKELRKRDRKFEEDRAVNAKLPLPTGYRTDDERALALERLEKVSERIYGMLRQVRSGLRKTGTASEALKTLDSLFALTDPIPKPAGSPL